MSRRSTRFSAVTNPEDESVPIPTSAKEIKRKRTSDDTASEGDDILEALQSPPKPRRGRPPTKKKALGNSEDPELAIGTSAKKREQKHNTDNKGSEGNNTPEALRIPPKPKRGQPPAKTKAPDNLEVPSVPIAKSAKVIKRKRTADDTADEGDDTPKALQSPSKEKRGRPPAKKKAMEIEPKAGKEPANSDAGTGNPEPLIWRGKVLPPRSPQAERVNRNTHPGVIAASKPKRTSAEVAAAVKRKADLQRQADELERRRIETLAEMELQEELDEEAEEYSVVRKQLDDEDVEMQPGDGEGEGASVGELAEGDHETDGEGKVAPKRKQVYIF
jgi:hypothetical protein